MYVAQHERKGKFQFHLVGPTIPFWFLNDSFDHSDHERAAITTFLYLFQYLLHLGQLSACVLIIAQVFLVSD